MKPIPTILLISICVVTAVYWDDKPERAQVSNDQAQAQPPTATPERKGDNQ